MKLRYIHLCCGEQKLPAPWENFDRNMDVTKPLPIPSGSCSYVFIEHGLEHFTGPQGFRLMEEVYRVLCSGGIFRVCVPQLMNLSVEKARDIILNHTHQMVYNIDNLMAMLVTAGFSDVTTSPRKEIDSHWKKIGLEQDDLETLRVEAIK